MRDGLQHEKNFLTTDQKVDLVRSITKCKFPQIECTYFADTSLYPQFSDSKYVARFIDKKPNIKYFAMVRNLETCARAIKENLNGISINVPACKDSLKKVEGIAIGDLIEQIGNMVLLTSKHNISTRCYINHCMGSVLTNDIQPKEVDGIVGGLDNMGIDQIILQDTTCSGNVEKTLDLIKALKVPKEKLGVHFYDTKYDGLEKCLAALSMGINKFTVSLGGIGGSIYYNSPLGNMPASDFIFALECLGIEHSVNWRRTLKLEEKASNMLERENLSDVYPTDFTEDLERYKKLVEKAT